MGAIRLWLGDRKKPSGVEDAPQGHLAHNTVKLVHSGKYPSVFFKFRCGDEEIRVQATVRLAVSIEEAARILRLCYMKLEGGASKGAVIKYRDELYRCRDAD